MLAQRGPAKTYAFLRLNSYVNSVTTQDRLLKVILVSIAVKRHGEAFYKFINYNFYET